MLGVVFDVSHGAADGFPNFFYGDACRQGFLALDDQATAQYNLVVLLRRLPLS